MNKESTEEIDQQCKVCDANIEVGSAYSQCSNRDCPTRDRNTSLSTDATTEEMAKYIVAQRVRKMNLPTKDMDIDPQDLAAKAYAGEGGSNWPVTLVDVWDAAEEHLDNRPTTFIAGHEFGWNCGACSDVNYHDDVERIEHGDTLECSTCGNEWTVRLV
jgi:hypothetical protein